MLCSPLKVNRRFRGTHRLHLQGRRISQARNQHERRWQVAFTLVSCLVHSLTLEMETCSSETSVVFQWTTCRYIPENRNPHNQCCDNLKSYIIQFVYIALNFVYYCNCLSLTDGHVYLHYKIKQKPVFVYYLTAYARGTISYSVQEELCL
jgi:hypothetical protein